MTPLTIKFPDRNSAELFMEWLKLYGEDDYHKMVEKINMTQQDVKFTQYDYRNLIITTRKVE